MLRSLAAIAALAMLVVPGTAQGRVVFDGRWSAPGRDHWDAVVSLKPGNRNVLRYVTSPRRRSQGYAADLRVGGSSAAERIEFWRSNLIPDAEGTSQWWAWSVYVPSDRPVPRAVVVLQIASKFNARYCSIARGGASTGLRMTNPVAGRPADRWFWTVTGGRGRCRIRQARIRALPVVTDRWIDFACHFTWSSTAAGRSKCSYRVRPAKAWTLAFSDVGPNLVSAPAAPGNLSIQHGLYKSEARSYAHLVDGGLVVADTAAQATRAAFDEDDARSGEATQATSRVVAIALVVVAGLSVLAALTAGRLRFRGRRMRRRRRGDVV